VDIATNKIIGKHDGVTFFTYGQNKGLSLSGQTKKYFVCNKDIKKNILFVCDESHKDKYLSSTNCKAIQFNWINGIPKNKKITLRFRHRQKLINGEFKVVKNVVEISYKPTLSVTPGQFVVLYQKNICLGGGIVESIK
jgi:tRNA-specific 2-thiouridylase